ncbi:recombinase family protein, partial [Vibrio parahaemolyticus]|uniref:recombinase family protein n=1 Tax=Vibrio parahaemolyticus TaxID=670 RepID=UPI00111E7019
MRYVAYLRVSSHNQVETGDSIDGQRNKIINWAHEGNHHIVGWYIDEAKSAYHGTRAEFSRMLDDLEQGLVRADGVIVYSLSRFSRNLLVQLQATKILEKLGISLVSAIESFPENPEDQYVMVTMLGVMNEHQSRQNGKVVSDRLMDTARKGFFTGGIPPYGYKSIEVAGDTSNIRRKLEIVEEEADLVRHIFELAEKGNCGKGIGIKNILGILNGQGLTYRGKRWSKSTLSRVLNNPVYYGERLFGKNSKKDTVVSPAPAILSKEQFDRTRESILARGVNMHNSKSVRSPSLLTGILRCAVCGGSMVVTSGKSGKYKYYQCSLQVQRDTKLCSSKRISKPKLDKEVREKLIPQVFSEQHITNVYSQARELLKEKSGASRDKMLQTTNAINGTKVKAKTLIDLLASGELQPNATVNYHLSELNTTISNLEATLKQQAALSRLPLKNVGKKQLTNFVRCIRKHIESSTDEQLKQLLLSTFKEIKVLPEKKILATGANVNILRVATNAKTGTDFSVPVFGTIWRRDRDLNPRYAINV